MSQKKININHPSGNLKPSESDIALTERVKQAGKIMNIKLLDHIILTEEGFCSLMNEGFL